jgi:hypothetical protein
MSAHSISSAWSLFHGPIDFHNTNDRFTSIDQYFLKFGISRPAEPGQGVPAGFRDQRSISLRRILIYFLKSVLTPLIAIEQHYDTWRGALLSQVLEKGMHISSAIACCSDVSFRTSDGRPLNVHPSNSILIAASLWPVPGI